VQITYCDQSRNDLDPEETLWNTLAPGGDYIDVGGNPMHVVSYLKNFLFDPKQARERVGILSGGQANRLLLAKNLASPGSLLILDEPTNDLDMDTLDMIQEILSDYNGTLIVVSHDRDFLDSLVTKTIYFAGDGVVEEFVGSYQSPKKAMLQNSAKKKKTLVEHKEQIVSPKKLTYATQRELDMMPEKIASLEERIDEIEALLMDANLYQNARAEFDKLSNELVDKKAELSKSWDRWAELG
jgi:ATP-binding cassette subfamily F protein uup